jgi:hypothetical protein
MGMDLFQSNPKRVPPVADLRTPNDYTQMDLGGRLKRNRFSRRYLLRLANGYVHTELRTGRLGNL